MNPLLPEHFNAAVRPARYQELDAIEQLFERATDEKVVCPLQDPRKRLAQFRRWYFLWQLLSLVPRVQRHLVRTYVARGGDRLLGAVHVAPINRCGTTWQAECAIAEVTSQQPVGGQEVGAQLVRHCLEEVLEARNWVSEVPASDKQSLAIYRQNGFQPLVKKTYWAIAPEQLQQLAQTEPNLPNLNPVGNADAQLLCQLDTAAMPPAVRQVFDRHVQDFKLGILDTLMAGVEQWFSNTETISGYVFEPQRQVAAGYFQIQLHRDGKQPHTTWLTVHPGYNWLVPELLCQIARLTQEFPQQSLHLASADYQQELERYLTQLGARDIARTLLMSRSVWHKLREPKLTLDTLQLSEVLQRLQPARKPVPSRFSWQKFSLRRSRGATNPSPFNHASPSGTNGNGIKSDRANGEQATDERVGENNC